MIKLTRKVNISILLAGIFSCLITVQSTAQTYKVEEVTYEFVIKPIEGLNSKYDDFAPVRINDILMFTSGREANLVLKGENNWKKTGHFNIFSTTLKDGDSMDISVAVPELFSKDITNGKHTGPACFVDENTMIFTQVPDDKKNNEEISFPQLYISKKIDGKWQNVTKLPFCQSGYSYGHPSWDSDKNVLYFVSNLPGGKGGKDIYRVKQNGSGDWGTPENVEVNSTADEMFPHIIGNDLFFSSNREGGDGKLDLYWKLLGTTEPVQHIDELSSKNDDHSIFINNGYLSGYFSQRNNGNDDIYFLEVIRKVRVTNELAGKFIYRNLGTEAAGLELQLLQEDSVIFDVNADENGEFKFRELPYENYTIKTKTSDNLELVLYDKDGNPNTYLIQDGEGKFQYKKVDTQTAGTLSMLEEMNEGKWLDYTDISGQFVYEKIAGEYGDSIKVMLVDEDGNIIFSQYTDQRGNFTFNNIPTDQNYTITTENVEEDMFLFIFDKNGDVYTQLKCNKEGEYIYKKIKPDLANNLQILADEEDVFELKTVAITGNFNYKKLEGDFNDGLTVYLYSEDGFLLDSTTTSRGGNFMFRGLDPEQSYLFKMKEDDPNFKLDDFNLFVEDRYGNVLADLYRADDGFYRFKKLATDTTAELDVIAETDNNFVLDPTETKNENKVIHTNGFNIYFDLNSSYTNLKGHDELNALISEMKSDKNLKVEIYAYADCRSSDQYNMWLSERRGERVKEFLIKHGISESRIDITAYGESKLVNQCEDGMSCPDEEHAKNRRVEVSLVK